MEPIYEMGKMTPVGYVNDAHTYSCVHCGALFDTLVQASAHRDGDLHGVLLHPTLEEPEELVSDLDTATALEGLFEILEETHE